MNPRLLLPVAGLLLTACQTPQWENQWGLRGSLTVVDEYDLDVDGNEAATDYESVRGGLYVRHETLDGEPIASTEYLFGAAEFGDLEATEFAIGSRFYVFAGENLRPFLGLYSSWTDFGEEAGVDYGSQVTIGPAVGFELPLGSHFFVDAMVDYQIPVFAAESDDNPVIEREAGGLSVFVGVGLDF